MNRLLASTVVWLSMVSFVFSQGIVVQVPAPTATPINMGSHALIEWRDGVPMPCPAGTWSFQNFVVYPDQTIGPMSQSKVMQLSAGWMTMGSARNLPAKRAAVGWIATHAETGRQIWLRQGTVDGNHSWWAFGSPGQNGYPWSGNSNTPYFLVPTNLGNAAPIYRTVSTPVALKTSLAQADSVVATVPVPPAPEVWLVSCPLSPVRVFETWVTHNGETAAGPIATLSALSGSEGVKGLRRVSFVTFSGLSMTSEKIPEGALGRYLYMEVNGQFRRQLALPWLEGTPGNDKYLRPIHDNQPCIWSAHAGPVHQPSSNPCSVVTPLQRAMYAGDSYVTPAGEEPLYGPVIIGYVPSKPTQALGGLAGWRLRHTATVPPTGGIVFPNDHPTYWPAICTQNGEDQMTVIRSLKIKYEYPEYQSGRGAGLSIGVTGCDYSGGQAFKLKLENCFFKIDEYDWRWGRYDLYVNVENQGIYGHTPSEWRCYGCNFQKIKVGGGQSINFCFEACHISAVQVTGTLLRFKNLIMPGGADAVLFDVGDNGGITDEGGLFVDVPCYSLFDCNGGQTRGLSINSPTSVCGFEYIVRSPMNQQKHDVRLENWLYWRPGNEPGWVYSGWRNVQVMKLTGSDVLQGRLTSSLPVYPYGNP